MFEFMYVVIAIAVLVWVGCYINRVLKSAGDYDNNNGGIKTVVR